MSHRKFIVCLAMATVLALGVLGLAGCGSSRGSSTTTGGTTTTPSFPYEGEWTMVAAAALSSDGSLDTSAGVTDASGTAKITTSSITISGSLGSSDSFTINGKYDSKDGSTYVYKLNNDAGYAGIGRASTGPKPYVLLLSTSSGSTVGVYVEKKTSSTNSFVGRWRLSKAVDGSTTETAAQFEQATGGACWIKFTPGGSAVLTVGGKSVIDPYAASGSTATLTDSRDGTKTVFKKDGSLITTSVEGLTLYFEKA